MHAHLCVYTYNHSEYSNRSVLAFHHYEPPRQKGSSYTHVEQSVNDSTRLDSGLMLTEFSVCMCMCMCMSMCHVYAHICMLVCGVYVCVSVCI
jgi:hypothetical protein